MEENNFNGITNLKVFIKCFIIEMAISILGLFILALILSKTNVNDDIMVKAIIGISAFAISIGGFISSRSFKMKGIISGSIQGIFYMLILYLISSIASQNFTLVSEGIIMLIVRYYIRKCWRNYRC